MDYAGIGTSVFYGYFFDRFTREHENVNIITACFSGNSKIMQAIAFEDGRQIGKHTGRFAVDSIALELDKSGAKVIYLYDGPPAYPPP